MGRKNLKQKIAFVLATIVGTNILWQNVAISSPKEEINALQSLGDYKTYNGVVFGKHTASGADVEGKLAVKGDIEAPTIGNSFSIAAAFNGNNVAIGNPIIDTTTPTFLLGGEIIDTGTTAEGVKRNLLLSAGIGVLTSKANKDLLKSADKFEAIIEKSEAEVYETFDKIQNDINKSIEKVKTIESSDEKVSSSTLKFARAKLNKNILINEEWRNEKHLDFKGIDSWEFRIPKLEENDHLIMYSEAETINFDRALYYEGKEIGTYDKALMHKLAPRILWVFPNAKTIETLRVDVPGSIIAPNATVNVYGGSINGQVFTNDLNQIEKDTAKNGQLHNFIFNWDILNDLEVAKGSLEIKKVESDNQDLVLSGAEFVIKDVNGNEVVRGTTDKNGIARFENLVAGTYTYEEVKAPEGYELNNEPVEFKITDQGQVVIKVVENKKIIIKGTLEIKKVDADNKNLVLQGAEFVIKDVNGDEVARGTTDEKGIARFENLVAGTYTYEEIKAPDGYELNNEPVKFEVTKQGEVITKVVENKKIIIKGTLEIKKVDADNKNLVLQGAEFVIKDANGDEVAKGTTDKNGIARFENLVAGTYTYEEVKAPEGYELKGKPIEFEITKQGEVITKIVENKKIIKGAIEIKKVDADNNDLALPGAEFIIKDANGDEVAKGITDEKGIARFENLVAGTYTYEEIKAPDGYELNNEPVKFEVTKQGEVITKVVENKKIIIKGTLEIKKVDADNKNLVLQGAEFVIKDANGDEVAKGITDEKGIARFENLVAGTYTYEEIKAPEGYKLNNEPVEFKITKQGEVITKVVENKKIIIKGTLEIKKVDADNKDLALSGAEFIIKDISGNEVARGTTDKNGIARFENLVAGTYTYEEIKAPEGYELNNEPVEFKITDQGQVVIKVVENKKIIIKGTLEIKKVDADNKDLALSGAEFVIKDVNGNEVAKGITDKNGIARFENLVAGTYTYEEVKSPDGYELNSKPIEFEITKQGEVITKVVENKKIIIKGTLEIKKVDADNNDLALQGAEFVIKDVNGNEVAKGTTDKNGIAKFENLVAGTYTYEEVKAPEGYELNSKPIEFEITKQGEVITKVVENKKIIKGALEIKKVDADNKDLALQGAEFVIKDVNGNEVAKGTTDEKGIAKFENLVAGTYTYEEIKAPEGYELNNEPVEFKITDQGQVVIKVVENNKIIKGTLEIKKVDTDKKNLVLQGAEFVIKDANGDEVAKGITDEKGIARFENLVAGTYTYEEIKAPDGYELNNEPVKFEITKQGEVITKVVENKKIIIKGTLEIKKVDADNKDLVLQGAEFIIKDVNGNEVAKGTTDKNGIARFENLVAGTYTYEEVKAPEGYELNNEPVEFKITDQGQVVTKVVENKKIIIKGTLEIKKVDADNKDLVLQGAEFVIKDTNGDEVARGTTDKNGIARFENLVAGTYTYEEIKAPEGYELNSKPIEFEITKQGEVITKVVENNKSEDNTNKPSKPNEPENKPEEPSKPDKPGVPENPDKPIKPEVPSEPSKPENKPEDPSKPNKPGVPESPDEPVKPEVPSEPSKPENKPEEPSKPDKPGVPESPDKPIKPEVPSEPSKPENKPEEPGDSENPGEPSNPEESEKAEDLNKPTNPEDTGKPENSDKPNKPEEPSNPENPKKPEDSDELNKLNEQNNNIQNGANINQILGDERLPKTGDVGVMHYSIFSMLAISALFGINKKRKNKK